MAREDLILQLLAKLHDKKPQDPPNKNAQLQKIQVANDLARMDDSSITATTRNRAQFRWGGIVPLNFSRNSGAYMSTGLPVLSNEPRYSPGYFCNLWNLKDSWSFPGDTNYALSYALDPAPFQGSYTLSALVTVYPDDAAVNPHFTIVLDYTDGTSQSFMVTQTADGVERFYKVTATPTSGKTIKKIRGWVLDYATYGTRHATVRQVMLNPGMVAQTWRPGGTGKASGGEEGTTNLFLNGGWMDGTLTSWVSYSNGGATGTRAVEADATYGYRLHLNRTGQTASLDRWGISQSKTWANPPGLKPSVSFYIKVISADAGARLALYADFNTGGSTPTYYYGSGLYVDLTAMTLADNNFVGKKSIEYVGSGWYKVTFVHSQSDVSAGNLLLWIDTANAEVELAWSQFEAKAYGTSFTKTTRSSELLSHNPPTSLGRFGTIGMWVYVNPTVRRSITSVQATLFCLRKGTTLGPWIWAYWSSAGELNIQVRIENTNVVYSQAVVSGSTPDGWHYVVVTFTDTSVKLYLDGVPKLTSTGITMPLAYDRLNLASREGAVSDCLGSVVDDVFLTEAVWTDAEVSSGYNATDPTSGDDNTLAIFPLDGSLDSLPVDPNWTWGAGQWQ